MAFGTQIRGFANFLRLEPFSRALDNGWCILKNMIWCTYWECLSIYIYIWCSWIYIYICYMVKRLYLAKTMLSFFLASANIINSFICSFMMHFSPNHSENWTAKSCDSKQLPPRHEESISTTKSAPISRVESIKSVQQSLVEACWIMLDPSLFCFTHWLQVRLRLVGKIH